MQKIHSINFPVDVALIARYESRIKLYVKLFGHNTNKIRSKNHRTNTCVVGKPNQHLMSNIKIKDKAIDQIKKFCYLRSLITVNNKSTKAIKSISFITK